MSESTKSTAIDGVILSPLKIMPANGGDVMRMLRQGSPLAPNFPKDIGEIYFSEILPGEVKAWKMHEKQKQLFAAPMGRIKMALYDMRAASPSLKVMVVLELGRPDNYNLLSVPPGVWYGFQCLGKTPALICNCPDIPHDPGEAKSAPINEPAIPFDWRESDAENK